MTGYKIRSTLVAVAAILVLGGYVSADEPRLAPPTASISQPQGNPWKRHVIGDRYASPDGTKVADINGDSRLDVVTGFEGQGVTALFIHPGAERVRQPWPHVIVGATPKAEDAVFVDLDGDGVLDIVSSTEVGYETVLAHFAPKDPKQLLEASAWEQVAIDAAYGLSQWMFAEPIKLASVDRSALVVGGKNYHHDESAVLGLLIPGENPRDGSSYRWVELTNVSWVMSIHVLDMNADGREDIVYSDKNGPSTGVWWLENPGDTQKPWKRRSIFSGGLNGCMLIDIVDVDGDGLLDVVIPVDFHRAHPDSRHEHRRIVIAKRVDKSGESWKQISVPIPPNTGQPKAATAGDLDGDGRVEIVVTSTGAEGDQIGAYSLRYDGPIEAATWTANNIGGPEGIKFDIVRLLDLDGDGDLDVLTNEEKFVRGVGVLQRKHGLGVVWYENPGSDATAALPKNRSDSAEGL